MPQVRRPAVHALTSRQLKLAEGADGGMTGLGEYHEYQAPAGHPRTAATLPILAAQSSPLPSPWSTLAGPLLPTASG